MGTEVRSSRLTLVTILPLCKAHLRRFNVYRDQLLNSPARSSSRLPRSLQLADRTKALSLPGLGSELLRRVSTRAAGAGDAGGERRGDADRDEPGARATVRAGSSGTSTCTFSRRDRDAAGGERSGEDHLPAHGHGPRSDDVRPRLLRRRRHRAADARGRVANGIALCPEGRRIFAKMTVEENLRLGAGMKYQHTYDENAEYASSSSSRPSKGFAERWPASCPAASSRCSRSGGR